MSFVGAIYRICLSRKGAFTVFREIRVELST
jgi:hypothetical protein